MSDSGTSHQTHRQGSQSTLARPHHAYFGQPHRWYPGPREPFRLVLVLPRSEQGGRTRGPWLFREIETGEVHEIHDRDLYTDAHGIQLPETGVRW